MIEMGVLRQVLHFTLDGDDPPMEAVGSLLAYIDDEVGPDDQPIVGDVVIYTLGLDRLRDLLALASAGGDIEGLILSLDAAALTSDEHNDDDDP